MGRHKKNFDNEDKKNSVGMPSLNLGEATKRGVSVVVFAVLALVTMLAAINMAGGLGKFILDGLRWTFGMLAYFVPVLLGVVAILLGKQKLPEGKDHSFYWRIYMGAFLFVGGIAGLIHIFYIRAGDAAFGLASAGSGGGYLGAVFAQPLFSAFGFWAGTIILFAVALIGVLVAFDVPLHIFWSARNEENSLKKGLAKPAQLKINDMGTNGFTEEKVINKNSKLKDSPEGSSETNQAAIKTESVKPAAKISSAMPALESITIADRRDWKLPPFDLLDDNKTEVDSGNIESNVAIIRKTLADFGIEVEMGEVNVGPTVTQYTLRPATGVKLSQIAALQNDLALALAAQSIRMELPIPGKALVGVEVPNRTARMVRLREVMQTAQFVDHKSKLALALGRDVAGNPLVVDLANMPHLLVAGATGTGKSVAINSLLVSLLYRNTPQDVKFIVIDPKRVEMTPYNGIPHLLTPVVTDHDKAVNSLKWAVAEMDRRYRLLSESHKRNISEYNESSELSMHYIVILVDELADLMSVAQADVEAAIVRLAQMARAVGIHLVLATQRPSVEIITGLIKANITSRIAFAVASQIDSRTILDSAGAEKLLGKGDMLFTSAEYNKPKRVQGAFIGEKEVKRVVDFFKQQAGAVIYNEEILEKPKRVLGVLGMEGGDEDDPLLEEAAEEVRRAGKASASLLQRRLRVGYARAARLLDILEAQGIIGPGDGAKPREVFGISSAEKEEYGSESQDQENSENS